MKIYRIGYIVLMSIILIVVLFFAFANQQSESRMIISLMVSALFVISLMLFLLFELIYKKVNKSSNQINKLVTMQDKYKSLISVMADMIFIYDCEGNILDYQSSKESKKLFEKKLVIGKNLSEVVPEKATKIVINAIKKAIKSGEIQEYEYNLKIGDTISYFETRMIKQKDDSVLAIVRDISVLKRRRMQIDELRYKDQLTNLYNRRYFDEEMERLNTELFLPLGVIMIDVNGLKLTNDVFGHLAGDALLIKIVGILKLVGLHTEDDFIARIGGDEFAIICPNIQDNEIEAIIMNINERTKNNFVNELPISLSLGWDIRETMANTWEETFISAENKMYRMKLTESKRIRNQIIQIAMKSLNQKNINERKHSLCVGALSGMIAEFMGLSKEAIKTAETAGLLHDIGKIAVQQELLSKPGLLTEKEFEELKKHSENGYQILRSVDSYSHLADIVLSHHERMDGKGYPRGFMEEEIPIASRIISIAEAYEALRIDRPYHKGVNHKEATREILANAGSQFDERIVRVFIEKFKEEDFLEKCQGGIINE